MGAKKIKRVVEVEIVIDKDSEEFCHRDCSFIIEYEDSERGVCTLYDNYIEGDDASGEMVFVRCEKCLQGEK